MLPNVNFSNPGFGETIDIRSQGNKVNTSVKVLLNGIPLNSLDSSHFAVSLDLIDIADVERIELIAGGGSVLYGGGTSGGVVNIITKTPTSPLNARVSSKISSYSTAELGAGVSTLFENGLFAKLSAKANDGKTHRDGEKIKHKFSSARLGYEFNDSHKFCLMAAI